MADIFADFLPDRQARDYLLLTMHRLPRLMTYNGAGTHIFTSAQGRSLCRLSCLQVMQSSGKMGLTNSPFYPADILADDDTGITYTLCSPGKDCPRSE